MLTRYSFIKFKVSLLAYDIYKIKYPVYLESFSFLKVFIVSGTANLLIIC